VVEPAYAPLPLSYAQLFVHEMDEVALIAADGPITFFTVWHVTRL
jgi:hypothetical protein